MKRWGTPMNPKCIILLLYAGSAIGDCTQDSMTVGGTAGAPRICGVNTGLHSKIIASIQFGMQNHCVLYAIDIGYTHPLVCISSPFSISVIVDADANCNDISFQIGPTTGTSRTWDITVRFLNFF